MQPTSQRTCVSHSGTYFPFWQSLFILLFVFGVYLYVTAIRPWLQGFSSEDFGILLNITPADTYNYWYHAVSTPLTELPLYLLGPVSFIKIFGANFALTFLFYIVVSCYVFRQLSLYRGGVTFRFLVVFIANPLIMFQFFAPNKEIAMILSLLLLVLYVYSSRFLHLFLALLLASFSKPEFLGIITVFLITRKFNVNKRPLVLISMVLAITMFYSSIPRMDVYAEFLSVGQTEQSLGLTVVMQQMAVDYFLFPVIIIPRILLAMFDGFAMLFSAGAFSADRFYVLISGVFFLRLIARVIIKRRLQIKNDEVFLLLLFLLMVSVVPFPHHRYVVPAYPLLLLIVLGERPVKSGIIDVSGPNTNS